MSSEKPVVCISQARMTSTRLPGKILMKVGDRELLDYHVTRLSRCTNIDRLFVATTLNVADDPVEDFCRQRDIECFRGDEHDVLERYYRCAVQSGAETVVRVTSDCPLIDPVLVDEVIGYYHQQSGKVDYVSLAGSGLPRGLDVEVFSFRALELAYTNAREDFQREHVTPYIYQHEDLFSCGYLPVKYNYDCYRWCVDEPADFELVSRILLAFAGRDNFSWKDCIRLMEKHPDWVEINSSVTQKSLGD